MEKKNSIKNGTEKSGTLTSTSKEIIKELMDNPSGLRANTLVKLINTPRRTVYRNLNQLKQLGLVENIYPIWQLCQNESNPLNLSQLLKSNDIELHDLSFVIRLIKKPDWWEKRENKLMRLKEFQVRPISWGNNPYTQIIKNSFIIQLFSNSIIFISQKRYWGNDTYDCFIEGTKDFLDTLNFIEERFRFKFFPNGIPIASVRSQHYVKLEDLIAKRCRKTEEKYEVIVDGNLRLLVDKSHPDGLEGVDKNHSPEDIRILQDIQADQITNPETPMPSKVYKLSSENTNQLNRLIGVVSNNQDLIQGLPPVLAKLEQEIVSHLNLIDKWRKETEERQKPFFIRWIDYFRKKET